VTRAFGFCAVLGVTIAAVAAASAAEPQYRIGILSPLPFPPYASPLGQALITTLAAQGDVLGKNLTFERRAADGHPDQLPALANELVAAKVDAILAFSYPSALAAAHATSTIPIVVLQAGDPVRTGMVKSLARPGGNITGVSEVAEELSAKRLEVLKDAVPNLKSVAMLWNADDLGMSLREKSADTAARKLDLKVESLGVRAPDDFNAAFATMDKDPPGAILMVTDALTNLNRKRVYDYAGTHKLPAIFEYDAFVKEGGLMSYGPDQPDMMKSAALLLDHVLKGAKPADLPLEQPTRFVFAVNLKTAKAIGLEFPQSVVIRADEVIE
jgi:putative tryptophan/tyrosine transport system substrate-binding protein